MLHGPPFVLLQLIRLQALVSESLWHRLLGALVVEQMVAAMGALCWGAQALLLSEGRLLRLLLLHLVLPFLADRVLDRRSERHGPCFAGSRLGGSLRSWPPPPLESCPIVQTLQSAWQPMRVP